MANAAGRKDHIETIAVHAGVEPEPVTGAIMTPIFQTSTYAQSEVGRHKGFEYSRTDNPTRSALQSSLAALEGGAFGLAFASGMAATDAVLRLLEPGDHVLCGNDLYGGTYRLFTQILSRTGLQFSFADPGDLHSFSAGIRPNTKLIWIETPSNPYLRLADISAIAALARSTGTRMAVDNTFATPVLQRPLELGADIVMHSTTKYIGGHSDVVGGAVIVNDQESYEGLKFLQNSIGAVPGPFDCFLTLRGIKTLALRMERHSANAAAIADFLASHHAIEQVFYPGLKSHPEHAIAARQMSSAGGMLSFIPTGGVSAAVRIAQQTRLFTLAESLGGVESLIEMPASMTHASVAGSPLEIHPALIRLSVGIENVNDLLADLDQALTS